MNDLELAKTHLHAKNLTLAIAKNGKVLLETDSRRISGFIAAIEKLNDELQGASVADRVVGKALALLCVYSGINQVYAEVLSKRGRDLFEKYNVSYEFKELVDNVLGMNKTGMCPFETLAADISNPKDSYPKFKALLKQMSTCK